MYSFIPLPFVVSELQLTEVKCKLHDNLLCNCTVKHCIESFNSQRNQLSIKSFCLYMLQLEAVPCHTY